VIASLALAFTAFLAQAIGPNVLRGADSAADPAAAPAQAAAAGERWQPWSPARVQALLGEGRPVFVDFTAAWCVTCQYNKKTTLASAEVLAAMDAARVQTLRADWTRRDAVISAELQAGPQRRAGVRAAGAGAGAGGVFRGAQRGRREGRAGGAEVVAPRRPNGLGRWSRRSAPCRVDMMVAHRDPAGVRVDPRPISAPVVWAWVVQGALPSRAGVKPSFELLVGTRFGVLQSFACRSDDAGMSQ
jgi:hypothetical protein